MTAGDEKGTGERTADEYVHSSYTSFRHFKHKFDFIRISVITQHCHERGTIDVTKQRPGQARSC